ncbi:type II CRISPR-associated endonuclease Cas1 [Methylolobus aquaticus]
MSEHRVLLIENPAYLSVDLGRLRIRRPDHEDVFVLPRDIAVLCLHHHTVTLTVHVLRCLAEAGCVVLVTDALHFPCGLQWPYQGAAGTALRLRRQIALDSGQRVALWQALVAAKIRMQAAALRGLGQKGALYLERMAKRVQPGDAGKLEGRAARHYWKHLMGQDFTRQKRGASDKVNGMLNFGYAVLRSSIARELAMAALTPALGLGHDSSENPFNLADDFIEPYRPLVDRRVRAIADTHQEFDGACRLDVLAFMKDEVRIGGQAYRLPAAIAETVASYCRVLDGKAVRLSLPCD